MQKHHHYTKEQIEWAIAQPSNMTWQELADAFNEKFGTDVTGSKLSDRIGRGYGVRTRKANCQKTRFSKGAKPKFNIGDEVIKAGYIWVKVNDKYYEGYNMSNVDYRHNWKRKADIVWERANGEIPKGKFLVYLDKNPLNCELSNLYLVDRAVHVRMAQNNWYSDNPELTLCALKECEIIKELKGKKR